MERGFDSSFADLAAFIPFFWSKKLKQVQFSVTKRFHLGVSKWKVLCYNKVCISKAENLFTTEGKSAGVADGFETVSLSNRPVLYRAWYKAAADKKVLPSFFKSWKGEGKWQGRARKGIRRREAHR
jgi:hypothetical protein